MFTLLATICMHKDPAWEAGSLLFASTAQSLTDHARRIIIPVLFRGPQNSVGCTENQECDQEQYDVLKAREVPP